MNLGAPSLSLRLLQGQGGVLDFPCAQVLRVGDERPALNRRSKGSDSC
jgi:hypothetical protein